METNKNLYTRYGLQLWEASEEFAKHCDGASYSDFRTFFCHVAYNILLGFYNNTWRNVTGRRTWAGGCHGRNTAGGRFPRV